MEKIDNNEGVKVIDQEEKKQWGGARKGSGRKDGQKKQHRKRVISIFLTEAQWAALEKEAAAENSKLASLVNKKTVEYAQELMEKHGLNQTNINIDSKNGE
jgi:hypothetical protein